MLIGRFAPIVVALAITRSLAGARVHVRTGVTLDTAGPTLAAFPVGVIAIFGGHIYPLPHAHPRADRGTHRRVTGGG